MNFNETQAEILTTAYLLNLEGKGQVLMPHAYADAVELEEAGWLERRMEENGHASWWWTAQAEGALTLNALRETATRPGSQN